MHFSMERRRYGTSVNFWIAIRAPRSARSLKGFTATVISLNSFSRAYFGMGNVRVSFTGRWAIQSWCSALDGISRFPRDSA